MLDTFVRPWIDPPLNALGRAMAPTGVSASQLTLTGMVAGLAAGAAIAFGDFGAGLCLILLSRLLDGLDGAVARATQKTDFGGYLDILCDFVFYAAVPLGFGLADPGNRVAALVLLSTFILTAVSFLAYATLAEKRGLKTQAQGEKSFYYMAGLAEGTETIVTFVLMCLRPGWFTGIAYAYAVLCVLTVIGRSLNARTQFASTPPT